MILDRLSNLADYTKLNPQVIQKMSDFIAQVTPQTEVKKDFLDQDMLYAMVQEYIPRDFESSKVEIHRRYIDVHVPLAGSETLYYCPIEHLELIEDFTPKSDDLVYKINPALATELIVSEGSFVVFLPNEGHIPGIKNTASLERNRKIVFKIDGSLFSRATKWRPNLYKTSPVKCRQEVHAKKATVFAVFSRKMAIGS